MGDEEVSDRSRGVKGIVRRVGQEQRLGRRSSTWPGMHAPFDDARLDRAATAA